METHFSLILSPDAENSLFGVLVFISKCWDWWCLPYMQLEIEKSVYVLYLSIDAPVLMLDTILNFSQQLTVLD
jgi:hypothetical protein